MNLLNLARTVSRPVRRAPRRLYVAARTRRWPAHSHLFVVADSGDWVLRDEADQITSLALRRGISCAPPGWALAGVGGQSVFYFSQFVLLGERWRGRGNRVGVAYYHGRPGTEGVPEFDLCYRAIRDHHRELERIQVSHRAMEEVVLESGIAPEKVFRIPIAVDLERFPLRDEASRLEARARLGLPIDAFVLGSFQKDGVGWSEGMEPKLIKGPDVFLGTVARLRGRVPELYVLLTGPARGYVKAGLEKLGVPYRHRLYSRPSELGEAYRAIDVYLVSARQEGGPKAVLEAMASGVPLVTTPVGQAVDLVRAGENGLVAGIEDADGLSERVADVYAASREELEPLLRAGRATAEENSYAKLAPRWNSLFDGFVSRRDLPSGEAAVSS
jgi:glycosyltransferase involved in cell wall biosynthesis